MKKKLVILSLILILLTVGLSGCTDEEANNALKVKVYSSYQLPACMTVKVDGVTVFYKEIFESGEIKIFESELIKPEGNHNVTVGAGWYEPEYGVCSDTGLSENNVVSGNIYIKMGYYGDIYISEWKE